MYMSIERSIFIFKTLTWEILEERWSFEWLLLQQQRSLTTCCTWHSALDILTTGELLVTYRMCSWMAGHYPFSLKIRRFTNSPVWWVGQDLRGHLSRLLSDTEIPFAIAPCPLWVCLLHNWVVCLVNWPSKDAQKGAGTWTGVWASLQMTWRCGGPEVASP